MSIRILICLILIFPIGSICFGQTISVLTLDTTIFTTEEWSEISKAQDGLIRSYADVHIKDLNGVPFSEREKELFNIFNSTDENSDLKLLVTRTLAGE